MRSTSRFMALAGLAVAAAACGRSIDVRTMAEPGAAFSTLRTFRMLPAPERRDGRLPSGDDDPMVSNSIANRAIRQQIVKSFQERGYVLAEDRADFAVAFYATAREKLDLGVWDYGYPVGRPGWPMYPRQVQTAVPYVEGSVVIDVILPDARQLIWRGEGRAELNDDPTDNLRQLVKAAGSIVAKFPAATVHVVADQR